MTRPEPWQLVAENYPVSVVMQTRFQDIDPNRHLNNVAFAALFENARVRLNRELRPWGDRPKNERSMVAAVTMFQNDRCIATCDSVIVCRTDGEGKPLRAAVVAALEKMRTTG